jgi:DNA (cytosine-5)-methyltransferase 1
VKNGLKAVSLFSGAGGMDVGFVSAGFETLWANDFDSKACETYAANHSNPVACGDVNDYWEELEQFKGADLVFGGPPCQGFSVAGKMDPSDARSQLLWAFVKAVEIVKPRAFVCENVQALATLEKWRSVRELFLKRVSAAGYGCGFVVLCASEYGVPQSRQRVFFIGLRARPVPNLVRLLAAYQKKAKTIRQTIEHLGPAGNPNNNRICRAKITIAETPVLRRSPYAGMLFNGLGRPLKLDGYSATLPASMGGNKTPIVDEEELYQKKTPWIEDYHSALMRGVKASFKEAPPRLRRLTIDEAIRIQTFPENYVFHGPNSAVWRQIGNAVPPALAECVARAVSDLLTGKIRSDHTDKNGQTEMALACFAT